MKRVKNTFGEEYNKSGSELQTHEKILRNQLQKNLPKMKGTCAMMGASAMLASISFKLLVTAMPRPREAATGLVIHTLREPAVLPPPP